MHDYPHRPAVDSVKAIQKALAAEGLYKGTVDGVAGPKTKAAYAAWQRHLGYSGTAADGTPGKTSLTKLGNAHGFTVVA
ncbi:peptidoglycan-binding domain-containing protein [Actinacidiphila soli]|uniref:peptidoglycan-binding domain-containing protein n=1 Tax=Actinacidiphila soli TaxID=2487275 RepID=UPI001F0CB45B|nr:peptidoglycan-binding domain-containing protein [Actinacidiphila soli]